MSASLLLRSVCPVISNSCFYQTVRTTCIVERRFGARLRKCHKFPKLRNKQMVYNSLDDNSKPPKRTLTVLLKGFVEKIGQEGDIVTIKETIARLLILNNKAVYPTQENLDEIAKLEEKRQYSSKYVGSTAAYLHKLILGVSMNKEEPWELQPWHIRASFRKAHICVPDGAFTMPDHPIKGPNMELEGKEFIITVKINKTEAEVPVRCRIHHWTTNGQDRLPRVRDHWKFPAPLIFENDKEISEKMPELIPPVFDERDTELPAMFLKPRKRLTVLNEQTLKLMRTGSLTAAAPSSITPVEESTTSS